MNIYFHEFGISRDEVKNIVENHFKENADILIGVDDPEVNQLVDVLVDAFSHVIEQNNKQLGENIESYFKGHN